MNITRRFARQPHKLILAEMAVALIAIGILDFYTSYQFRLLPLYAGPIFVVGWFFGLRLGITTALISGVTWWGTNWFNGDPDLHSWFQSWEITRHVGFFLIVAWAGGALRAKSDIAAARIALLEHSRQLEEEIINISESEQRRIGQDLHDGVCQVLAALSCSATSLRADLEKCNLPEQANMAGELARLLQTAVVETRDLAGSLVPAHVSEVGLTLAVEALAQSVTRLHRLHCTFELIGRETMADEEISTHLYRIAQEAINNAIKHGKAQNIVIQLEIRNHWITLRVTDDGVGIPANPSRGGMGLAVMQYRARVSGGELAIDRLVDGGTRISCRAPISTSQDESIAA
jgi:signal transduction histidine kinase